MQGMSGNSTSRLLESPHFCFVTSKELILSSMKLFTGAPEVYGEAHVPDLITSLHVHLRELMRHLETMSLVMNFSGSSDVRVREKNEARARRSRSRAAATSTANLKASFSAFMIAKLSSDCSAFSEKISA